MRARVASWITPVVRVLPYLVVALILIVPLVFATAWDSFLAFYERIWEAFGRGRVVDGVAGLLQLALLAIAVVGVALTFALASRRLDAMVWRWSEGKPVLRAGLSSARFGLAIVAVAAVGVALFTWLPNDDRATTDGGSLQEALERASNQVATLLGTDDDTASAEEVDPESSGPGQLFEIITEAVLPQRDRKEPSDASEPSTSKGPSSEQRSNPDEQSKSKTASPSQQTDEDDEETAEPNPLTLAPRGPVPTVAEAPPMSTEEPAATAPAEPPAAEEDPPPVAEEPPLVAEEPPPVAEEPPPVVEEPPPVTEEPPTTEVPPPDTGPPTPSDPPPEETPPPKISSNIPPDQDAPSSNCTTSPGEEPGSTITRCTT